MALDTIKEKMVNIIVLDPAVATIIIDANDPTVAILSTGATDAEEGYLYKEEGGSDSLWLGLPDGSLSVVGASTTLLTDYNSTNGVPLNTGITEEKFINGWIEIPSGSSVVQANAVDDFDNVSTGEAFLIDGNYTNLCYNNSSTGSNNKALPAIDFGAPIALSAIHIYWWSTTYTAIDFKIQASDDGATWNDVATNLSSVGIVGLQVISFAAATFRYWRVYCVTGSNPTFVVLSEMEGLTASASSLFTGIFNIPNIQVVLINGEVVIENDTGSNQSIQIRHFG